MNIINNLSIKGLGDHFFFSFPFYIDYYYCLVFSNIKAS